MLETNDQPLLTLAILGYNQERFIRDAIAGALAQTYSPLEIILSDDCSKDGTFGIMQKMAADYHGPHRVVLNRNKENRGVGAHINRVFELSHGELLVGCAGDDVSVANRVQANYDAWEAAHRKPFCLYSGYNLIDDKSQPLQESALEFSYGNSGKVIEERLSVPDFFGSAKPRVVGCATTYSPRLLKSFGVLPENIIHEDDVLAFRAICLGPLIRIESPLVQYRIHDNNVFSARRQRAVSAQDVDREEARLRRELETRHRMFEAFIHDLAIARSKLLLDPEVCEDGIEVCEQKQKILQAATDFLSGSFFRKCQLLIWFRKQGVPIVEMRQLLPRLLPSTGYRVLKSWRNRVLETVKS